MIKYLVMDVDGTLTDGKIYMSPSGEIMKAFNIKDGLGIHDILIPSHITPVIVTGRRSDIVNNRCKEIGITEIHQGVHDKLSKVKDICGKLQNVAYVGDDINDLECMTAIKAEGGLVGCPEDAAEGVKEIADFRASHRGGDGAVREFIEWIISEYGND